MCLLLYTCQWHRILIKRYVLLIDIHRTSALCAFSFTQASDIDIVIVGVKEPESGGGFYEKYERSSVAKVLERWVPDVCIYSKVAAQQSCQTHTKFKFISIKCIKNRLAPCV